MTKMFYCALSFVLLIFKCSHNKSEIYEFDQSQNQKINLFPEEEIKAISSQLTYKQALDLSDYAIFSKDIYLIDSTSTERTVSKLYIYRINNGKILKDSKASTVNKEKRKKNLKEFQEIDFLSKNKLWKHTKPVDTVQIFLKRHNKLMNRKLNLYYQHIENTPIK